MWGSPLAAPPAATGTRHQGFDGGSNSLFGGMFSTGSSTSSSTSSSLFSDGLFGSGVFASPPSAAATTMTATTATTGGPWGVPDAGGDGDRDANK
jgi:hypothetical protein